MAQYQFSGEAQWAKVYKPDEKYGKYSINVKLDEASKKLYVEAGCQMKEKDGYVAFRRPAKRITLKGALQEYPAPEVVDSAGKPITDLIGNGSHVTVTVRTYDTAMGVGTDLVKVQVNTLVKYEAPKVQAGIPRSPF